MQKNQHVAKSKVKAEIEADSNERPYLIKKKPANHRRSDEKQTVMHVDGGGALTEQGRRSERR